MGLDWKPGRTEFCCFTLVIAVSLGCSQSSAPPDQSEIASASKASLQQETWDVVFLQGERVGYIHTSVFREPRAAGEVLRIEQEDAITMLRGNNRIEAKTSITSLETPDGQLLEFSSTLAQGEIPMKTTGRVVGNELQLEVATTGHKTKVSMPWDEQFGGPYCVASSLKSEPLVPGQTRVLRYLDAGTNQLATRTLTATDFEETKLTGTSSRLLRVESELAIAGSTIKSVMWVDENGETYKEQIPDMFDYTAVRATKEEALKKLTQIDIDLGKSSAVPVQRNLARPHDTKRIVYRVHLESSEPTRVFASGPTQQVVAEDEHTALVTVYAIRAGQTTGNPDAKSEPVTDGDRQPNNLIQSDNPTVVELANQAAGQNSDPWQTALALEQWVSNNMTSRGMSSAFATAAEVARDLTGDCTEHAVLLTAMARARGIPARVAIGLVYYRQEFLYHMWTEVYIDGTWIPLDATLARGGIGGAHLKIADSNLQGASPNAAFLPVTEVIGQLKIEILEVE